MLTESDVLKLLRAEIERAGSLRKLAGKIGISSGHLSRLMRGEKRLSEALPVHNHLGLRCVVDVRYRYERVKR